MIFWYILVLLIWWDDLSGWAVDQGWEPGVAAIVGGLIVMLLDGVGT